MVKLNNFRASMSSSGFDNPATSFATSKIPMPSIGQWFTSRRTSGESPEPASTKVKETKPKKRDSVLQDQVVRHQIPAKPTRALMRPLPSSSHNPFGTTGVLRRPPLMDNLARSTFASSSSMSYSSEAISSPIVLSPTRSCMDTLRSMKEKEKGKETKKNQKKENTAQSQSDFFPNFNNININWFRRDDKQGIDQMLKKEDRAESLQKETEHIRRKYRSPRNPVVFCHGLLGFDSIQLGASFAPLQVSHWRGIKEVLEANGTEILITRVPATSSISDRAKVLLEQISKVYSGKEVHLIGHSMGGLDCRYLTSHLEKPFKVLSVTTIATPHRGSTFADYFIETVGRRRIPSVVSLLDLLPNGGGDGKAFESLTTESMRRFNEEIPDSPGVHYFSWGAVYDPGLIDTWRWPHTVVMAREGPNDGLVSVESSKWGTYLGTLENVNHLDLVGWINSARYKWAEFTGREIAFKPATFYLGIADHLARAVEGQGDESDSVIRNEDIEGVDTSPVSKSNPSNA